MNIAFARPEERADVLAWVRSQPGHADWNFLNWSDVLVVRDANGKIRGISEMAQFQTAEFVLDVSRKARDTHRTWTAMNDFFDQRGIHPLVIASSGAELTKYARKLMKKAFVGFEFFRR